MSKIQQLNEHITNMIAAGEVVERPMGIVKECVENAIDAHASSIEVRIEEGGLSKISIIDDGDGMDFQDARMAFERHATSKIKKEHDLWNIHSLGFRGEAIPSIASVAEVDLKTNNGEVSTIVQVHYGRLLKHEAAASPKGTQIDISNLFQKTPARFKHLKTTQYEFSLISDVIQKFALGYPNIAFRLVHNQVETFRTTGRGNLQEVIMQIYGREIAKAAIPIECLDDDYHVSGYIVLPQFNRATKYYMYVYMNQRMIRHQRIYKAIKDAYSSYLPHDRYPIAVLNVEMDAQLIDVNVHPSKWEVRLAKEKQLENLVYRGIQEALREKMQVPQVQPKVEKMVIETPTFELNEGIQEQQVAVNETVETYQISKEPQPIEQIEETKEIELQIKKEEPLFEKKEMNFNEEETIPLNPSFPSMRVIGQFHSSYILAEGEKGLYIIDQHAAQEKYHYEQLSRNIFKKSEMQSLLIPEIIQVTPSILIQLNEINEMLKHMQLQLECFGEDSVLIREIPIWLKDTQVVGFIQDILDYYTKNQEINAQGLRKAALASMACHSSIRFNRNLTLDEMKRVVEDLKKCEQPFHCPHGRPTLVCISDAQLIKDFYR